MNDVVVCGIVVGAAILGLLMAHRNWTPAERPWVAWALVAHLCAALAQVLIVRGVYGYGDMISYYRSGFMVAELWRAYPLETTEQLVKLLLYDDDVYLPVPGLLAGSTGAVIALSSILMLLVNDSLYAGCMVLAVLAFVSRLAVYRVFQRELSEVPRRHLLLVILWMPSAVFWSSGILKESFAIAGLGLAVSGGYRLAKLRRRISGALVLVLGMSLTMLVKPYILIPFGVAAGAWLYLGGPRPSEPARRLLARSTALVLGLVIAAGTIIGIGRVFPRFAPGTLAEEASRMQALVDSTNGGSDYVIGGAGDTTIVGQLAHLPLALASVLFRPLPFEVHNATMAMSAVETSGLTVFLLIVLWRCRVFGAVKLGLRSPVIAFCIIFTVGLAAGVGLGTTNLGTLSRYRAPMISFYGVLLVAAFHEARSGGVRGRARRGAAGFSMKTRHADPRNLATLRRADTVSRGTRSWPV